RAGHSLRSPVPTRRRADQLRHQHRRHVPPSRHLLRANSQGRQAGGDAGDPADQVRAGDQSQDRRGARPDGARQAARDRRRGRGMKRRDFIALVGGTAITWPPHIARAQPPTKTYHVPYLALAADLEAMIVKQRLEELGYSETKNLIFNFRSAQGHTERLPPLAAELVKTNPDVIVAGFGTATAKAAQAATAAVPIVFT